MMTSSMVIMGVPAWAFSAFIGYIICAVGLDIWFARRSNVPVSVKRALFLSAIWISQAIIFCGLIYWKRGRSDALDFATGYLVEESLSVDNLFVFLAIFSYFKVPKAYQQRVLLWGVLGAILMRAIMILGSNYLLSHFESLFYLFGAFLVFTGIRLFFHKDDADDDMDQKWLVRFVKRVIPFSSSFDKDHFFTMADDGRRMATPLLLVLILVEVSDVIFAFDSVPAIFAITKDPFIVFSSNIFAVLGLRAMFFALAGTMSKFRFLHLGLACVLIFIGIKMILNALWHIHISSLYALGVILGILIVSVICSVIWASSTVDQTID